jgi:hypothetical protein
MEPDYLYQIKKKILELNQEIFQIFKKSWYQDWRFRIG